MSIQFSNLWPVWCIALLAVLFLAALAHGTVSLLRKNIPTRLVAVLAVLRLAILAVFVLALLQPVVSTTRMVEQRPELLVLVDASRSMGRAAGQRSRLDEGIAALRKDPWRRHCVNASKRIGSLSGRPRIPSLKVIWSV